MKGVNYVQVSFSSKSKVIEFVIESYLSLSHVTSVANIVQMGTNMDECWSTSCEDNRNLNCWWLMGAAAEQDLVWSSSTNKQTNKQTKKFLMSTICWNFIILEFQNIPNTHQVPDHQAGVEAVQAESHPGCRDAVSGVKHVSGQRAGLCFCHDLLHRWDKWASPEGPPVVFTVSTGFITRGTTVSFCLCHSYGDVSDVSKSAFLKVFLL